MIAMTMGLLLMTGAPAMPERPDLSGERHVLKLADEVTEPMSPYVECRLQSAGAKIYDQKGKAARKLAKKGGDCAAIQARATADTDAALKALGKDDATRATMIATAVKQVDDFAEEMRAVMAASKGK